MFGQLDLFVVVPTCFHLTQFLPDHFVARLGIATDIDTPHIDSFTRIDENGKGNLAFFLIDFWRRVNIGEGVTSTRQFLADRLGARVEFFA